MNFFSHYYFDHIKGDPIYNFGLLTPDLLRNFTPNAYNKHKLIHPSEVNSWNKGILQHIQRDKLFHQSAFFDSVYEENRQLALELFEKANISKFWFALHVLIEMILDKHLIQKNNALLEQFYNELKSISTEVEKLLNEIDHKEINIFTKKFEGFHTHQYLYKYQEHQGIIYGLNRIYNQIKLYTGDWNSTQFENLIELSKKLEISVENNFNLI